jgi:hypothetical protein
MGKRFIFFLRRRWPEKAAGNPFKVWQRWQTVVEDWWLVVAAGGSDGLRSMYGLESMNLVD